MKDNLPEITEDFSLIVTRSDGSKSDNIYKNDIGESVDDKIDCLAKEVLNERRRTDKA